MEKCIGVMALFTKEHGWSISPMEKAVFLMAWWSLRASSRMARWSTMINLSSKEEESVSFISMDHLLRELWALPSER